MSYNPVSSHASCASRWTLQLIVSKIQLLPHPTFATDTSKTEPDYWIYSSFQQKLLEHMPGSQLEMSVPTLIKPQEKCFTPARRVHSGGTFFSERDVNERKTQKNPGALDVIHHTETGCWSGGAAFFYCYAYHHDRKLISFHRKRQKLSISLEAKVLKFKGETPLRHPEKTHSRVACLWKSALLKTAHMKPRQLNLSPLGPLASVTSHSPTLPSDSHITR